MEKEIRYVDFKSLRIAYVEVKRFVEDETFLKVESIHTRLVKDLGCTGDDNVELLEKFVSKYNLDHCGFVYEKHFHTEYELFGSEAALINLLKYSAYSVMFLIWILSFGTLRSSKVRMRINAFRRPVDDLTIGDMLSWYLEKEFKIKSEVSYKLAGTA
jgi:hypothetical protein